MSGEIIMLKQPIVRPICALLTLCLLTACGFHLRNQSSLPSALEPIYIGGNANAGTLGSALRYQLTNSNTKVAVNAASANYRLMLLGEGHEKRIISLDRRGLAAEYGLIASVEFELLDHGGNRVLGPLKLQELRTVTNNPDNALTTAQEIDLVQTDINKALAELVVRRLGAFATHRPSQPSTSTTPPTAPIDATTTAPSIPATEQPTTSAP